MTRLELLALMAAIVHKEQFVTLNSGKALASFPESAVETADAILRAAEHRYPADRPEEAVLAKGAAV